MAGYFRISTAANGQFTFNLKAGNHEVILTSRMYDTMLAVRSAIEQVRQNSGTAARFERKVAKDNSPYFVLNDEEGQMIGRSEMYSSAAAMEIGIRSVMTNGASTIVKGPA
jgi:uncharacterized protein YegP (UPF0339 family)